MMYPDIVLSGYMQEVYGVAIIYDDVMDMDELIIDLRIS